MPKFADRGSRSCLLLLLSLCFLAVPAHAGLTYVCDPNITNLGQGCNYLNSAIQSLYTSYFQDVNANIYIQLGATALGGTTTVLNNVSYAGANGYYAALNQDKTSPADFSAVANLPANQSPGNLPANMRLTNANVRALPGLGITPTTGVMADGATACTIGNAGCYDAVVTLSQTVNTDGEFWFRNGPQASDQYDFYAVVEHETDEVLGTGSCAFDNQGNSPASYCIGRFAPMDLFRYHSNGTLAWGTTGSNSACFLTSATNACFSIDGTNMGIGFNNILNGANTNDAGDYSTNCAFVQDAAGCMDIGQIDVLPSKELMALDVVGYTQVPEPAAFLTMGAGLAVLIARRRRRKADYRSAN
jgi:hypothetical protein